MDQCADSETCMAAVEAAWQGAEQASQFAREKVSEAKEHLESQCASSELCQAGAEVGSAVKKFASALWKTIAEAKQEGTDENSSEDK